MVSYARIDDILEITIDNPPVNALSTRVRRTLFDAIDRAEQDELVRVVVIRGARKLFSAGADIIEFDRPEEEAGLSTLVDKIEACAKPVIALIHSHCLGGGLEVAMGCHYRIATRDAQFGLPEVTLGLLPGAGGTQRLPRLVGLAAAIDMIATGNSISAEKAQTLGLVDHLTDAGGIDAAALDFSRAITRPRRTRDRPLAAQPGETEAYVTANARKFNELDAPKACIEALKAATVMPFAEGLSFEKSLFNRLARSDQARALRHAFFAERQAAKIQDLPKGTVKRLINRVGVIGAGTMGTGIAMNFLLAGIPVTILDTDEGALQRGADAIARSFSASADKGRLTKDQLERAVGILTPTLRFEELERCDLIIEAVFEDMAIKQDIFRKLDQIAKPGAILASNTSFLDINEMAIVTRRPQDVVGLHFFSPANIMKLVEVVHGARTGSDVLATCMDLAQKIGKAPVLSGVCHGFIGNRMLLPRLDQAKQLLLEGASIDQIDQVSTRLGLPIGPLQMIDLAGVDVGWHRDPARIENLNDALCARGRLGQKSGRGYYDYDSRRRQVSSPEVQAIVEQFRSESRIAPRAISDEEILVRTIYVLINEAALILDEGIAQRASDIDTVWMLGFGWPRSTGGPLWWASRLGLANIIGGLERNREHLGAPYHIANSLIELANTHGSFYRK